jgi:hypothetical protein
MEDQFDLLIPLASKQENAYLFSCRVCIIVFSMHAQTQGELGMQTVLIFGASSTRIPR